MKLYYNIPDYELGHQITQSTYKVIQQKMKLHSWKNIWLNLNTSNTNLNYKII